MKPRLGTADSGADTLRRRMLTGAAVAGAGSIALLSGLDAKAHGTATGKLANVRDFGAIGDGVSDDTVPIRNAFASTADVIYFPAGTYLMKAAPVSGAALVRNQKTLVVMGDGPQASQLVWEPPAATSDHLIKWTTANAGTDNYDRLEVRNITLKAARNAGTAIHATKSAQAVRLRQQVLIENVEITGLGTLASGFTKFDRAIFLDGLEHARIRNVTAESNRSVGGVGIEITSMSSYVGSLGQTAFVVATDFHLHHVTLVNFDFGLKMGGRSEGFMVTDSVVIGCRIGFAANVVPDGRPGVFIRGCHFACAEVAIDLGNTSQATVSDNLIYMNGGMPDVANYVAIDTGQFGVGIDKDTSIRGNTIFKTDNPNPSMGSIGIFVRGSAAVESILVADNRIIGFNHGILLWYLSNGAFIAHTNQYRACTQNVVDAVPGANYLQP